MNTKILSKDKDPMGAAIFDYQKSGRAGRLRVLSSMFEEDEMPVKHLLNFSEEMFHRHFVLFEHRREHT